MDNFERGFAILLLLSCIGVFFSARSCVMEEMKIDAVVRTNEARYKAISEKCKTPDYGHNQGKKKWK